MTSDFRRAARALRHAPGFTLVTAATLALGIGATAAIFKVVNGVLLAPLPYPKAERIVAVTTRWTSGRQSPRVAGGDFVEIRQAAPAFEALAYYFGGEVGVQLPGHADFTPVYWTTADLFRVFGAAPLGGRAFDDDQTEAVVSEEFAVRHFDNVMAALGQHLSGASGGQTGRMAPVRLWESNVPQADKEPVSRGYGMTLGAPVFVPIQRTT